MKQAYIQSVQDVLRKQNVTADGLTSAEVQKRQAEFGPNKLKDAEKKSTLRRFLDQLKDPMLIILMVAAAVSAVTNLIAGESLAEVFIILIVVLLNAILGVVQESKAEAAIEALQTMTAATCKVIRDGKQISVHSDELVPGDIVVLEAGDAVPADGRIIECASLKIEEAALTGESVPVNKLIDVLTLAKGEDEVPLGDRKNMCYMGSTCVYGRGKMVVTGTGMDTEMGKIAGVLAATEDEQTPLQRKLDELSVVLSKLVLGICVFIFAFNLIKAGDFHLPVILDTFMVAVSLAVAAIPEGLSTVVTLVLSIGVTNMSKRNAVIRKMTAVETLGCTQVICSDKTGTIVSAVGEGRRIYDNIRKAIQFLLASNMSEVLGVFCSSLMGFTLLNPVHLLFINLFTDTFPALALGMEKGEPDTMERPPRDSHEGIFARGLGVDVVYQGVLVTVITIISYLIGNYFESGAFFPVVGGVSDHGMTMAFLTMSMCEIFHSFNVRSQRKSLFSLKSHNKTLWLSMLVSLVLTTAVLEVPFLANAFGFTPIGLTEYLIALGMGILVIPVVEIVKFFQRKAAK